MLHLTHRYKLNTDYIFKNRNTHDLAVDIGVAESFVQKWRAHETLPTIFYLTKIAEKLNTNLSFLLCATCTNAPNDTYEPVFCGKRLRMEQKRSKSDVSRITGCQYTTICRYEEDGNHKRTEIILAMAEAYGVSIDYILSLTAYRTWDEVELEANPFYLCKRGEPAYIKSTWIQSFCLIDTVDGNVIMPNGKKYEQRSELFHEAKVFPIGESVLKVVMGHE